MRHSVSSIRICVIARIISPDGKRGLGPGWDSAKWQGPRVIRVVLERVGRVTIVSDKAIPVEIQRNRRLSWETVMTLSFGRVMPGRSNVILLIGLEGIEVCCEAASRGNGISSTSVTKDGSESRVHRERSWLEMNNGYNVARMEQKLKGKRTSSAIQGDGAGCDAGMGYRRVPTSLLGPLSALLVLIDVT